MLQQQQLEFEHRPYGAGDPNGNSWSEKVNVRSMHVIANDGRDRRLHWDTAQEGSLWRASFQVLPRPVPRREHWERPVAYTGGLFRTKRDAKEDACRFLLEEQQRLGRLPGFIVPKPPPGQAGAALGQGVMAQPAPGGGAGQAGPARPRLQTVVAKTAPLGWLSGARPPQAGAKVPPLEAAGVWAPPAVSMAPQPDAAGPLGFQRDPLLPSPAAGQDPGADRRPQEGGAEATAEGKGGAGPSVAGLAGGGPDSDEPGAFTSRLLLSGASPPSSPQQPRPEGDFCASDSHTPTEIEDDEGNRVASVALREQDEEAKAALAAEELAAAELVPAPEEPEGDIVPEGGIGAQEWFGGPDPGSSGGAAQGYERLPLSPDKRSPASLALEEMYKGVKVEQGRGRRFLLAWSGGWLGAACPCGLVHSHSGKPGWDEFLRPHPGGPPPLGLPLTGCLYGSPLASPPLCPFLSSCFFPHSLRRGGGPKGLSRTATWRTGQPCSPRPDDPGPSWGRPPSAWHQRAS